MGMPIARVPPGAAVPAGSQAAAVDTPPPAAPSVTPPVPGAPSSQPAVAPKPVAPTAPKPAVAPAAPSDTASEAALTEFLERQILPYLAARRGYKLRLGNARFSEDTFRFVRLRITEAYRMRVDEIQAWCDERRMLDLQIKLHHWLHGWLFVHVPISFLLLMLTAWHAFVTLFYY
jgi:hypothetical protein